VKPRPVRKLDPETTLVENAARIVRTRLDEMRSFAPAALHPECANDQHDLRIAAKRLRYVLESTGFCFGDAADTARRRARDVQSVLGDLHDCDLMLPRVTRHVERLRAEDAAALRAGSRAELEPGPVAEAPHRTAYRGLQVLAVNVQARRGMLFERFVELWGELEDRRVWDRLERAIERELRDARQRRAAAERAAKAARELEQAERAEREAADRARRAARALDEARRIQRPRDQL